MVPFLESRCECRIKEVAANVSRFPVCAAYRVLLSVRYVVPKAMHRRTASAVSARENVQSFISTPYSVDKDVFSVSLVSIVVLPQLSALTDFFVI